jgi:hypothetical protein
MNSNDIKKITWITVLLTLIIWWLIQDFVKVAPESFESLKNLATATSATAIFWVIYGKFLWTWPILNNILYKPDIRGTWLGEFQSDWKDINGKGVAPGKFVIVIRQEDFLSLSVIAYTKEMHSVSNIESLLIDDKKGIKTLGYIYNQKRSTSSEYAAKQGAAELKLIQGINDKLLSGDFWTLAKSTGYVNVRHTGKTLCVESFDQALKIWPDQAVWASVSSSDK